MAEPNLTIVKSEPLPELTLADKPEAPAGAVSRFASGAWQNLNPMGLVSAATHPIDTVTNLLAAHKAQYDKAKAAFDRGRQTGDWKDYSEAAGHLGAAALPVLGPAAAAAGEQIGAGDVAGGLGAGTGLVGSVFAPRAVPTVAKGATSAAGAVVRGAASVAPEALARVVQHGSTAAGALLGHAPGAIVGSELGAALAKKIRGMKTAEAVNAVLESDYDRYLPSKSGYEPPAPVNPNAAKIGNPRYAEGRTTGSFTEGRGGLGDIQKETRLPGPIGEPVPLSQAVNAVQKAVSEAKLQFSAEEFQTGVNLVKKGMSQADAIELIKTVKALKATEAGGGMVTTPELRADMGQRARAGQKTLMPEYGDVASPAPKVKGKSPQQVLNEEALARRRRSVPDAQSTAADTGNPFR